MAGSLFATRACASCRTSLPPQVAANVAAPRQRTPSSRSCSTAQKSTRTTLVTEVFRSISVTPPRYRPGCCSANGPTIRRRGCSVAVPTAALSAEASSDGALCETTRPLGVVRRPAGPRPHALDSLDTPLSDVTFVVIDLETTGTVPGQSRIIEVAAAKFRGGECLGTFQTMVNPECGLPPFIVALTGITEALVVPAPTIGEVLPALLEFIGGAVLVGHNLRFDTSFLDADLVASGRPRLANRRVDTLTLARRLVRDEVADCRLATLAARFRTEVQPTHRALDD